MLGFKRFRHASITIAALSRCLTKPAVMALSHCRTIDANDLVEDLAHAAVVAARHASMAEARKVRCTLAEMRWRWTLKVLWAAA